MAIDANCPVFTTEDAADYLGLSVESVRKYIQKGRIKPEANIGRAYLILRDECDRFAKTRRPAGNPNFVRKSANNRGQKK